MSTHRTAAALIILAICCFILPGNACAEHEHQANHEHDHEHDPALPAHHKASEEDILAAFDPEFNIVGNFLLESTDNKSNSNRGRFRARDLEAAFQMLLLPSVRANIVGAMEHEYMDGHSETEFHLEEAYFSIFDLPFDTTAAIGRRLVPFGVLNPLHPHERPFADTPLVLANFLGEHSWYDDGVSLDVPVGHLLDLPVRTTFGYYRGRNFAHEHGHADEHDHHNEPVEWAGDVYLSRTYSHFDLDDRSTLDVGYSFAWDEGANTGLHGADLTYRHLWPDSLRSLTFQNELLCADVDSERTDSLGFYSMLQLTLDHTWDIGARYDWSETPHDDRHNEWAISPFVTCRLNESMFTRIQYRYREMLEDHTPENTVFLQFVWQLGAHSH